MKIFYVSTIWDEESAIHGDEYPYAETLEEALKEFKNYIKSYIEYFPKSKEKVKLFKITVEEIDPRGQEEKNANQQRSD
jgi:hypothetical protein